MRRRSFNFNQNFCESDMNRFRTTLYDKEMEQFWLDANEIIPEGTKMASQVARSRGCSSEWALYELLALNTLGFRQYEIATNSTSNFTVNSRRATILASEYVQF